MKRSLLNVMILFILFVLVRDLVNVASSAARYGVIRVIPDSDPTCVSSKYY